MKRVFLSLFVTALSIIWAGFSTVPSASALSQIAQQPRTDIPCFRKLKNGTSPNWAGYASLTSLTKPTVDSVTNVKGQWTVPTLDCAKNRSDTYSSVWVGIDGYSDSTVEQLVTEQDCNRSTPVYYAWYELYPSYAEEIS